MASTNRNVRKRLMERYGKECFIDKLHLRPQDDNSIHTYKSKSKRKLTYHHIRPKSKGGKATLENGALLSPENHEWLHSQPKHIQDELNKLFQDYKKLVDYNRFMDIAKEYRESISKDSISKDSKNNIRGER